MDASGHGQTFIQCVMQGHCCRAESVSYCVRRVTSLNQNGTALARLGQLRPTKVLPQPRRGERPSNGPVCEAPCVRTAGHHAIVPSSCEDADPTMSTGPIAPLTGHASHSQLRTSDPQRSCANTATDAVMRIGYRITISQWQDWNSQEQDRLKVESKVDRRGNGNDGQAGAA